VQTCALPISSGVCSGGPTSGSSAAATTLSGLDRGEELRKSIAFASFGCISHHVPSGIAEMCPSSHHSRRERCSPPLIAGRGTASRPGSAVVVQLELVRVRPEVHRRDLLLPLVVDPVLNQVLGEDTALGEVLVVLLETVAHGRQ